jgi:hypothetical protein
MKLYKYPRTFHLPWSLGITNDDKVLQSIEQFRGREVIVTEKMDGESASLYPNGHVHARSMDSVMTPYRTWLKAWWSERSYKLDSSLRICGEDLFAEHSIRYENLGSYFRGFSVWEGTTCLSWDETILWFEELGIEPVKPLYMGLWAENVIKSLNNGPHREGYVVRVTDSFDVTEFSTLVGKYVRANHVTTDTRWDEHIIQNGL